MKINREESKKFQQAKGLKIGTVALYTFLTAAGIYVICNGILLLDKVKSDEARWDEMKANGATFSYTSQEDQVNDDLILTPEESRIVIDEFNEATGDYEIIVVDKEDFLNNDDKLTDLITYTDRDLNERPLARDKSSYLTQKEYCDEDNIPCTLNSIKEEETAINSCLEKGMSQETVIKIKQK